MDKNIDSIRLTECIKSVVEKQMNEEYTKYKEECLNNLNNLFESKRNNIIGQALNRINDKYAN